MNRKKLVAQLDKVFSQFIRLRYSFEVNGEKWNTCVTCGERKPIKELQCGHYISRRFYGTRWDEKNCWPQCYRDNVLLKGNYPDYALFLVKEIGQSGLELLHFKSKNSPKLSTPELQILIDEYKKKVKELS